MNHDIYLLWTDVPFPFIASGTFGPLSIKVVYKAIDSRCGCGLRLSAGTWFIQ